MKNWVIKNSLYITGAAAGAVAGYLYWKFVGCANGTCAITGKPVNSTIYFAVMGAILFGMFKREKQQQNES